MSVASHFVCILRSLILMQGISRVRLISMMFTLILISPSPVFMFVNKIAPGAPLLAPISS